MPAVTSSSSSSQSKVLNIGLWTVQILLGLAFGAAGVMKVSQPIDALIAGGMLWAGDMPSGLVRFIGLSELLGGIGLVLPAITRILPWLTALAAIGLVTIMVLAFAFHVSRGEIGGLPVNVVLGGLAAFVAWGRLRKAPIHAR